METTTDLVEENRKQEIIHHGFYTIYLFLFEAGMGGWVGGWLGVVSGSARLDREGTNSSWQRQKIEAKLEEQFCSTVLREPELELVFLPRLQRLHTRKSFGNLRCNESRSQIDLSKLS